jgi:hypothetical protein
LSPQKALGGNQVLFPQGVLFANVISASSLSHWLKLTTLTPPPHVMDCVLVAVAAQWA